MSQSFNEPWFVYIAQCGDGSLYTGITQNVRKRIARHNSGSGALHVRTRGQLQLLWTEIAANLSTARQREMQII
jgi:predicted GIY-YIG superfamily endonuclease